MASVLIAGVAWANEYPTKPVRLLVGFAPGGAVDLVARLLQPRLVQAFGKEIVIENRPGAAGSIAAELTAKASPDGYTLGLINHGALVITPAMTRVPYDPLSDLTPIARVVEVQNIFLPHPSLGARDLPHLVAIARTRPGVLNYASSGTGSAGHLTGELFARMAGIQWVHVPYKGGGPAMTDFLAGQLDVFVATTSTAVPYIRQGKLHGLGVSGNRRTAALPDVPTVAETGWSGFEASAWFALMGPARLPRPIVERWHRQIADVLSLPETTQQLLDRGMDAFPGSPQELQDYLHRETAKWGPIVKALGLRGN
jgi:tripartite-type tricarboxylate transporter receptor subunit TctC